MSSGKTIKIYHLIIVCLFLLEICSLFLTYQSYKNKNIFEQKEEHKVSDKKYAMYVEIENEDGTSNYEEYNNSNIFPTGYKINKDKTECLDNKGNKVENIVSGKYNRLTVTSNKTLYCYIYFDKHYTLSELCSSGDTLGSCLTSDNAEIDSLNDNIEGGLYRYQGTNEMVDDNYICFGTTNKEECISNTDAYMYRIIGIDKNNQLKLIKKEALNEPLKWYDNSETDVAWPNSTLYSNLNGDSYLNNNTYMSNGWSGKIVDYDWKYGDLNNSNANQNGEEIYTLENSWPNEIKSKVGLMYMHDYYLSYDKTINCSVDPAKCKTSWIYLSNNDLNPPVTSEWFMTRYGLTGGYYLARFLYEDGNTSGWYMYFIISVRPTIYLNSDEQYISGDGTINNPIIISGPIMHTVNVSSNNTTYGTVTPTTQEVVDTGNATITLSPASGYKYSSNTCGVEPVNNVITISNITSDKECTVTFEPNKYSLTLTKGTGISTIYYKINGASSYTSATSTKTLNVNYGSTYYYYGTASTGYTISSCTASNPCSGTMGTSAVSKTLSATLNTYTVSVSSTNTSYGTVSPASQSINHGSNATITLSPKTGYKYSSNTCGGTVSGNTMTISNITSAKTCTVTFAEDGTRFGKYLISAKTAGWNETAYGGMYRYIGTTANNYVKIGDVLYRIIGVTSTANSTLGLAANQVKVIKAATIGKHNWHTSNSDTKWESSSMYTYLQGSEVLGNTNVISSGWSSKIDSVKWNIGDVQTYTNGDTVYGLEDNTQTTNTSKVGLMYLSDYYYAYNAGGTTNCDGTACTNWLTDTSNNTWTMSRYGFGGSYYVAWHVGKNGGVYGASLYSTNVGVRPVFYLSTSVNWKSGTGTSGDPFIIE